MERFAKLHFLSPPGSNSFLGLFCLGMIYHIQKVSWQLDDQNPPQKLLTFKTFLLVGEGSDPDREDPNEILVLLTNLIFS